MNDPSPAAGGRYAGVRYFNGGLFAKIEPIELTPFELELIGLRKGAKDGAKAGVASQNWAKVNPTIFGTIFQKSMDAKDQHKSGAHYTSEADIQRIVGPTIVGPWRERIEQARSADELIDLRAGLSAFRILDPACGSGNFLYVSYRELTRLEIDILSRLKEMLSPDEFNSRVVASHSISPKQFFGIELDQFGAELSKVTLMLAKKLAVDEANAALKQDGIKLSISATDSLPLDNLDSNIIRGDALFTEWPEVEAIIGNPPFQSKNKIQKEYGAIYLNKLRSAYPQISGNADYCVYWIRIAHDKLMPGQRAGLVGTNTIRQNYSRESGLDYVVENGGEITQAVSSMKWSGEANLHVSVVNWIKGEIPGKKRLYLQEGNDPEEGWSTFDLDRIPSSLSPDIDVTKAKSLLANSARGGCFQGQTHGHDGFLLEPLAAKAILAKDSRCADVVHPFLIADDMIGGIDSRPTRYVIDFQGKELLEAQAYAAPFARVKKLVLPDREAAARDEESRNNEVLATSAGAKVNHHHANFLRKWWRLSWERGELSAALLDLPRYVVCGRVTKRPIFEFISSDIHPNDALQVFPYDDDYSFGILQSGIHWAWFNARCSTLTERPRYTSNTVFDSFPWPQSPSLAQVQAVAKAAVELRTLRAELRAKHKLSFRDLYRTLDLPGDQPMKKAQRKLDVAVGEAYGMAGATNVLEFLLGLNFKLADREADNQFVQGPGLPAIVGDKSKFITSDCVSM